MADLLSIATDRVRVSWTGPAVREADGVRVRAFRSPARLGTEAGEVVADPEASLPLAIPEEATLALFVQSTTGEPAEVAHRDPAQTARLVRTDGGRVVHGRVRVRDEAGRSTFVVRVGGRVEVEVSWRVLPTKLGLHDVDEMRGDVEAAWAGGARAAWSVATDGSALAPEPSRPAWVALLREAASRLGPALEAVARNPESDLVRETRLRPASRLRGDAASLAAIRKGKGRGAWREVAGASIREAVPVGMLRATEDVPAHRWIRARLNRAAQRLATILREETAHPYAEQGRRRALRDDLARLDESLRRLVRTSPIGEVSGARVPARAPLVLRRRPAYRRAFDALRLLDVGLGIAEGEVETAWLGTARLFETWAALAVVQEAAAAIGAAPPASPFGSEERGASVRVRRGRSAAVRLVGARAELDVAYEPRFGGPPALLAQRPDLLLTLRRPGEPPRRAVLDAKYRRDDTPAYLRRHGSPGPPEDALGDLHRYRDAIVGPDGQPLVERAAALYPHRADERFADSRLWASHAGVGVGAIPLAPGSREWLRDWISAWVDTGS